MLCRGDKVMDYATDERYTAKYIEREAALLILTFGKRRSKQFGRNVFTKNEMDKRILARWKVKA